MQTMGKIGLALIGLAVVGLVIVFVAVLWGVGVSNSETRLMNLINAKLADNKSEFDNMWKKISQTAEVPKEKMESLRGIFAEYAKERGSSGAAAGKGTMATWVKEAVPKIDDRTFDNLMNIIAGSRDRWTQRQKEILDHVREYNNLFQFPSSIVMGIKGKTPLDPNLFIVTSTRTDKAFETHKDDDVKLFPKSDPATTR